MAYLMENRVDPDEMLHVQYTFLGYTKFYLGNVKIMGAYCVGREYNMLP